jgi:hypothetical protein
MDEYRQIPVGGMTESKDAGERGLYRIAGAAAFITVLVMVLEMIITLLPRGGAGEVGVMTVESWFDLFHESRFMGLRNLGLMNMFALFFTIPVYAALYWIHRRGHGVFAALAVILYFIGIAIYLAGNTAFSMLALSHSYQAAATEVERTMILAAGRALLARGESHTAGTFLGFFFMEGAGIVISGVMVRSRIFGRVAGYAGIAGYLFLLLYDIFSSFVPAASQSAVLFVLIGGPLSLLWSVLIGIRLLRAFSGFSVFAETE